MIMKIENNFWMYDKYFMPNVKRMYADMPILIVEAKGAIVKDSKGREYIDLFSSHGVNFIGHCHPKVVDAIKRQSEKLICYGSDVHTPPALILAEKLISIAPKPLKKCFFANAGTEAVEEALYLARKKTGGFEFIALYGAFHGRTYGSRSALGWWAYKKGMGPYLPGFIHIPSYYCYRCSLGMEYPGCNIQCARLLNDALKFQCSGDVAAFIVEAIQGTAGNIPAPNGYFNIIEKILRQYGLLLILDEVYTGLGRTGKLWAAELYNIKPDIITVAKALGGGVPISATLASEEVASAFDVEPILYYTTYGSNPLSCSAALAALEVIIEEKLYERAAKLGEYFIKRLKELQDKYEIIGDVRGKGLMIGVELVKDRRSKEPAVKESILLKYEALKRGLILPAGQGWYKNVIRILPPAVITIEQIDKSIEVIEQCLKLLKQKTIST